MGECLFKGRYKGEFPYLSTTKRETTTSFLY